jgi:hypothetical protein
MKDRITAVFCHGYFLGVRRPILLLEQNWLTLPACCCSGRLSVAHGLTTPLS